MTAWAADGGAVEDLANDLLAILDDPGPARSIAASQVAAEEFLADLYALGLACARDPHARDRPEVRALLARGSDGLQPLEAGFSHFVQQLAAMLGGSWEWGDEWAIASERRSALEFVRELFGLDEDSRLAYDLAPLDRQLRARGRIEGGIPGPPEGMPRSHWWWWCGP